MTIAERLENLNTFFEKTKSETSRLEGTLEPIEKELMELCSTINTEEIEKLIATKKEALAKTKSGIEADLLELETTLSQYGYIS